MCGKKFHVLRCHGVWYVVICSDQLSTLQVHGNVKRRILHVYLNALSVSAIHSITPIHNDSVLQSSHREPNQGLDRLLPPPPYPSPPPPG